MKKGFTLFEILLVISIIAVLATLAVPQYLKTKEKVYDQQAIANLKLIQMAEKGYHIDTGSYYPAYGDALTINENLKLNLPATAIQIWSYETTFTGCGQARRNDSEERVWSLEVDDADGQPNAGVECSLF